MREDKLERAVSEVLRYRDSDSEGVLLEYECAAADWRDIGGLLDDLVKALRRFGIHVYEMPTFAGSDSYGLIITKSSLSSDQISEIDDREVG